MSKKILYQCENKNCLFTTSEQYNFCPFCGLALYLFDGEKTYRSALSAFRPEPSNCQNADECFALGVYSPDCEQFPSETICLKAMNCYLLSVRDEVRQIRKALLEAGLLKHPRSQAPPQKGEDLGKNK